MAATETPDPELRDALVRGIHTYERRRRRRLVGGGAVVVAAAAIVGGLTWAGDGTEPERGTATDPSIETGDTSVPSPTPGRVDDRVEVEVIDPMLGADLIGTDLVLLATNGNGGGIAVADLGSNQRAVVADAARSIDGFASGAVSAGTFTDDHLWLGPPLVAAPFDVDDVITSLADGALDRVLVDDGPRVQRAVATDSGQGIWLQSSGTANATVRLLDQELNAVVEVPIPAGLLTDVVGEDAVIDRLPEGDGGLLVVSPDGSTREIEGPVGAQFVTATPDHTVWSRPAVQPRELVIRHADGSERIVSAPDGRWWAEVAHPTIPSESTDLKSVTSDGRALLLGLVDPDDGENGRMTGLATVDLVQGEIEEVTPLASHGMNDLSAAFWSSDDSRIVAIVGMAEGQGVMWTEPGSGLVQGLGDVVPPGYFVIAAR